MSPGNNPQGTGLAATYSKSGLALNLAQGWAGIGQGTSSTTSIQMTTADAAKVSVGDQFQLGGNFLTGQNAGFEGGLGSWAANTNCTVADAASQAHAGVNSMSLTTVAPRPTRALYNVPPALSPIPPP